MKKYKMMAAVVVAGLALSAATTQAQLTFASSAGTGNDIVFQGTTFNFTGTFTVNTIAGPVTGSFAGGPFSYTAPVVLAGGVQTATVTTTGTLNIGGLTGNIAWVSLFSFQNSDALNDGGVINLTHLTYGGSNAQLISLAANNNGVLTLDFSFAGGPEPLTSLYGSSNAISDTYSGQIVSAVPEPSTVVAGLLMLLPLGIGTFRALRKERTA